jgi:hypothetical protein
VAEGGEVERVHGVGRWMTDALAAWTPGGSGVCGGLFI